MKQMDEATFTASVEFDLRAKIRASFFILLQNCAELAVENDADLCVEQTRAALALAADLDATPDAAEKKNRESSVRSLWDHVSSELLNLGMLKTYHMLAEAWLFYEYSLPFGQDASSPDDGNQLLTLHMESILPPGAQKGPYEADTDRMRTFMSLIPLRMTSARYRDYIKDAFHSMEYAPGRNAFTRYKQLFFPMGLLTDGGCADALKHNLDGIWDADPAALMPDEYNDARKQLEDTNQEIMTAAARLTTLFDVVSSLLILEQYSPADLLANDAEARRLYDDYRALAADGTTDEAFLSNFDNDLETAVNAALRDVQYDHHTDAFSKADEAWLQSDEMQQRQHEHDRVNSLFYGSGLEFFGLPRNESEKASTSDSETQLNAFIAFMDECVNDMSGKRKKFLRRQFLQYLPYPYDVNTYQQYFLETYKTLNRAERALLAMFVVGTDKTGRFSDILTESSEENADRNLQ